MRKKKGSEENGLLQNISLKNEMPVVGNINKQEIDNVIAQRIISKIKEHKP